MKRFKQALIKHFDKENKFVAFFERNFKSQHMQVQVVPVPKDLLEDTDQGSGPDLLIKQVITTIREHGLQYTVIPPELSLRETVNTGIPFFYLEIPAIDWQVCVHINTRRRNEDGSNQLFPMQLGRQILARILGLDPSLSHWKNVVLTRDQEANRAIQFRKRFADSDFTLEEDA